MDTYIVPTMVAMKPMVNGSLWRSRQRRIRKSRKKPLSFFFLDLRLEILNNNVEYIYLHGCHVCELILWATKCEERSDDKSTSKGETNSKFLRHKHHDWKKHSEGNEDEEYTACKK